MCTIPAQLLAGQRVWAANGLGRIEGMDLRTRAMRGCLKVWDEERVYVAGADNECADCPGSG